jgi:LacI family transcriptional regulator
MNTQKITKISDIAKELGVSGSTVSRALNDNPRISKDLIKKVKKTAAKMGYVPNTAAQSLRTGRSNTIGLIVRDISDGWSETVIPFIEKACTEFGYGLLLCNANNDPSKERYYLRVLQQRRIDGVLILTPFYSSGEAYLPFAQNLPLVLMDMFLDNSIVNSVTIDHEIGAYLSTRHLLELGHCHIAFIVGPLNLSPCARSVIGYKKAMMEFGIEDEAQMIVPTKHTDIKDGYAAMVEILKTSPRPSALATISDLMAIGAMDAAKRNGILIPDDFSIVGYDDIPFSALVTPPLTTILQDKEELSKAAVSLLQKSILKENNSPHQIKITPRLVLRKSTAPFRED